MTIGFGINGRISWFMGEKKGQLNYKQSRGLSVMPNCLVFQSVFLDVSTIILETSIFEVKTSLTGFGTRKKIYELGHHHGTIARASIPGGLDKILQARFSSSTWKVSEPIIRRLYINSQLMRAQLLVRDGEHSQQYQE